MRPETAAETEPPPSSPCRGISPGRAAASGGNVFRAALPFSPPRRDRKNEDVPFKDVPPRPGAGPSPFSHPEGLFSPMRPGRILPHARSGLPGGRKAVPPPKKNARAFSGRRGIPSSRRNEKKPPPCLTWEKGEGRALLRGFFPPVPFREGRDAHKGAFSPPQGLLARRCCAPIFPFFVTLLIFPVIFTCCFSLSFLRP